MNNFKKQFKSLLDYSHEQLFIILFFLLTSIFLIIALELFPEYERFQKYLVVLLPVICALAILTMVAYRLFQKELNKKRINGVFTFFGNAQELKFEHLNFKEISNPQELDKIQDDEVRPVFKEYISRTLNKVINEDIEFDVKDNFNSFSEDFIIRKIENNELMQKKIIIIDHNRSGKSLFVFKLLKRISNSVILIPKYNSVRDEEIIKIRLKNYKYSKLIIFLDDLSKFNSFEIFTFIQIIRSITENYLIIGTSTREFYFEITDISRVFKGNTLKLSFEKISPEEKFKIDESTGSNKITKKNHQFYVEPGDITMQKWDEERKTIWEGLTDPITKDLLRAAKLLMVGYITVNYKKLLFVMNQVFNRQVELDSLTTKISEIKTFFFSISETLIEPHPGYLENIVKYAQENNENDLLEKLGKTLTALGDAKDFLDLSQCYRFRGDLNRELLMVEVALNYEKDNAMANYQKAFVLARKGKFGLAEEFNKKALDKDPKFPEAWDNRSYILINLKRFDEARVAAEKAISLLEIDDAYSHLAVSLLHLGENEKAEQALKKALELSPNDAQAHYEFGKALLNLKEYDKALEHFNVAETMRADFAPIYFYKSLVEFKIKKYDKALINIEKAIELDPNFPAAHGILGFFYLGKKEFEKSIVETIKSMKNIDRINYNSERNLIDAFRRWGSTIEKSIGEKSDQEYLIELENYMSHLSKAISSFEDCTFVSRLKEFKNRYEPQLLFRRRHRNK